MFWAVRTFPFYRGLFPHQVQFLGVSVLQWQPSCEGVEPCSALQFECLYRFLNELAAKIRKDNRDNESFPKLTKTTTRGREDGNRMNLQEKDRRNKRDKDKGDRKKTLKLPKTVRNITEPLMSTKQSKVVGGRVNRITEKEKVGATNKNKPEWTNAASLEKDHEKRQWSKALKFGSLDGTKTPTSLKDQSSQANKQGEESIEAVGNISGFSPSNSNQNDGKSQIMKKPGVSKLLEICGKDHLNVRLPSIIPLETPVSQNDNSEESQLSPLSRNADEDEVTALSSSPSGTTPYKVSCFSEQQISECSKVIPPNSKLSKKTKTNTSKPHASDVVIKTSPADCKGYQSPETSSTPAAKTSSKDHIKELNDCKPRQETKVFANFLLVSCDYRRQLLEDSGEIFSFHQENASKPKNTVKSRPGSDVREYSKSDAASECPSGFKGSERRDWEKI